MSRTERPSAATDQTKHYASEYKVWIPRVSLTRGIHTLYSLACQVRVTVGDLKLCCCVCVTSIERSLTPLFVDSVQALWASFYFR